MFKVSKMLLRKVSRGYQFVMWKKPKGRLNAPLLLLTSVCGLLVVVRWLMTGSSSVKTDLSHLRRSRDLHHYLDEILDPLIEPSYSACQEGKRVPLVVLVDSAPWREDQRSAIRQTWGMEQPTFFFLGLEEGDANEQLVSRYMESKRHSDLILFDFHDTYQNLTLKTALMMRWSLRNCPQADFVLKADDDVMVNPWVIKDVIRQHSDAKMIGHKYTEVIPIRDPYHKWYLPNWLYPQNTIPEFLSGPGYLINGEFLSKVYMQAYHEPLINLEDIFFTYLVAKKRLGYQLTDDQRLDVQPFLPTACGYFRSGTIHGLTAQSMLNVWTKIKSLGDFVDRGEEVCKFYDRVVSWFDWR